ncbi:hypothetical protein CBFG_00987 [Clostridiales bacterium 1_7_47FAA]|nr:hypothetical protein CBFG_00987 [Clostridiales bacterium 1_7_47FAA]
MGQKFTKGFVGDSSQEIRSAVPHIPEVNDIHGKGMIWDI